LTFLNLNIKSKHLIAIQAILFPIFLLVTFYFNRFAADDYFFIGELRNNSIQDVYLSLYNNWSGRWSSNLVVVYLFKFNQLPFFLPIYNFISVGLLYLSIFRLLTSINNYYELNLTKKTLFIYTSITASVLFFCTISASDTWLWCTSSTAYLSSTFALFFGIAIFLKKNKSISDYIISILSIIFIGGTQEPLVIFILLFLFYLLFKKKKITLPVIGILILCSSFLINFLSPGSHNRDEATPSLDFINLILYTGYSSLKFLFFTIYKTFIPALFLGIPFYFLGKKTTKIFSKNFNPTKSLLQNLGFIAAAVILNQLIVVYALGGLAPDRAGITSSIIITILLIRFLYLLGNFHKEKQYLLKPILLLNVIGLICFNIYFGIIHFNYATAVDKRIETILFSKSDMIKVIPLPSSGYIYNSEITTNPEYFLNQHLKSGLGIENDIVLNK